MFQHRALPRELTALSTGISGQVTADDDQSWVTRLLQKHGMQVVGMLWRLLGSEEDVLDVYQTAVCSLVFRGPARARDRGAYFYRASMNCAVTLLRRREVERRHRHEFARCSAAERRGPCPVGDVSGIETIARLQSAIAELPDQLRAVIVLRDLAEMPYRAVARTLGIRVGTARQYRCQAIMRLASMLTGKDDL